MATWNTDKPALANQIANDLADIEENLQELHDVVEAVTNGTLGTTTAANFQVDVLEGGLAPSALLYGNVERAIFTYNGGTTAYTVKLSGARYWCKDKLSYWASELTTGAIGTPAADTWYYLYLDYSAITSGTAITSSELVWSDTAPSWSHTYRGWYNGDDRCIFAALTNSAPDNILEFFHYDNFVMWADAIEAIGLTDIDTSWTDVDISTEVPGFSQMAEIYARAIYDAASVSFYWRTNGQTGTSGHEIFTLTSTADRQSNSLCIITDSSQIIEVKASCSDAATLLLNVDGWYLPIGM